MNALWKGLMLRGIGLFLFWQWFSGNVHLYIQARFVLLVLVAALALVWIGGVYHTRRVRMAQEQSRHAHGDFAWGGLALVLIPLMVGVLAPRRPLGADSMRYRQINTEGIVSVAAPRATTVLLKPTRNRNILDWVMAFLSEPDVHTFSGEKATVSGFVYREAGWEATTFMVSRFVITCCAADATPVGLYVAWPESKTLTEDQWVEVFGQFEIRQIDGKPTPVLLAETVTVIDIPDQPYLYP
jgi:uncharacterized repeat protein (TIGR03943 family)